MRAAAHYVALSLLAVYFPFPGVLTAGTTGSLTGYVTDAQTGQPLVGVNVQLTGTQLGAATDPDGRFLITNIPAGRYDVRIMMMGYAPALYTGVSIVMDIRTTLDVVLTQKALESAEEVVVRAERPLIQVDVTGTMHSVTGDKVDVLPVDSFQDIVMLQPGATSDGHIRGGRETEVLYLIDGLPVQDAIMGGQSSDLPNGSIIEMTVQTGGFSAEYGNAMSGIVNVVTKTGGDAHVVWGKAIDDRIGYQQSNKYREYEMQLSGPIVGEKVFYLASANWDYSDTRWWQDMLEVFPSPIERNFNIVGKVDYRLSAPMKFTAQYLRSDWDWREYEYRWRYNLAGLPPQSKTSDRLSLSLSHTLDPNTYYTFNLSGYNIRRSMGEGSRDAIDPDQVFEYEVPFYYYIIKGRRLWWQETKEKIYLAKGDFSRHFGYNHLLKMGAEVHYFDLENDLVKFEPQKTFWGRPLPEKPLLNYSSKYSYKPYTGAIYVQDKIDREWLVMNMGIRYDFLDPRAQRPLVEWIPVGKDDYEQEISEYVPASRKHQISPRFGFSHVAGEKGFFFFNYGHFFQVPLFDYMYTGLDLDLKKGTKILYGNPDLRPEKTVAYEFSYKHELRNDVAASFTFFNKRIFNLVDSKTFLAADSKEEDDGFTQYVNLSYARVFGFELVVKKMHTKYLSGKIAYTWMRARGTSSDASQGTNYLMWGFEVPQIDYYLSWDQRHTVVADLFTGRPGNWSIDVVFRYSSPRPYTYFPSPDGLTPPGTSVEPNNKRMSDQAYMDLKITKALRISRSYGIDIYFDVRNVLNRSNVLWVASDGKAGGELGDPAAWDVGRRANLGVKLSFDARRVAPN